VNKQSLFIRDRSGFVDGWEIAASHAWNVTKPGQFKDIETMLKVEEFIYLFLVQFIDLII
jgi:hypothetical protein